MKKKVAEFAFHGNWMDLLPLLREHPYLINAASESKGYTPLHQAAWHGAPPTVIGQLLALGADPGLRTANNALTAREIAAQKHERRSDLQFLLWENGRTIVQLMRKIVAENPELFSDYDGNRIVYDRLIESLGCEACGQTKGDVEGRFVAAFKAVTGVDISAGVTISCSAGPFLNMQGDARFWANRFLPLLLDYQSRALVIPLEKHWVVIADLFDPAPAGWGSRGDPFLWMEMRQSLCHVPLPESPEALNRLISHAFATLTGHDLHAKPELFVPRFARGGMSSGMVSHEFWSNVFIPMLQQRDTWLHESWAGISSDSA